MLAAQDSTAESAPRKSALLSLLDRDWVFWGMFLGLVVLNAYPILTTAYPPFQDLGAHIELMDITARHDDPTTVYPLFFTHFDGSNLRPNTLSLHVARLLYPAVGTANIATLLLAFYAIGLPLAALAMCRAFNRSRWLALLSLPLVYNAMLNIGLLNFLVAIPLILLCVALVRVIGERTDTAWRWGPLLTLLTVLLFLSHALGFVVGMGLAMGVLVLSLRNRWGLTKFLWTLPSIALFVIWWKGGTVGEGIGGLAGIQAWQQPMGQLLGSIHDTGMQFFRSNLDEIAFVTLVIVWLGLMTVAKGPPSGVEQRWWRTHTLELATVFCLLGYFLLPTNMPGVDIVSPRLVIISLLLLTVWPHIPRKSAPPIALIFAMVVGSALYPIWIKAEFQRFEDEVIGGLTGALLSLPTGSVVGYDLRNPENDVVFGRVWHVWKGLVAADLGGTTNDSFARLPYSAIAYLDDAPQLPFVPNPRVAGTLTVFDYLLFRQSHPPNFGQPELVELLYAENDWYLYRVVDQSEAASDLIRVAVGGEGGWPDMTVCDDGQAVSELTLSSGSFINAVRMRCRPTAGGAEAARRRFIGTRGRGQLTTLTCPPGTFVGGFHGSSGAYVDGLGLICVAPSGDPSLVAETSIAGGRGGLPYRATCPSGMLGRGIAGRFGSVADRLELLCGPP